MKSDAPTQRKWSPALASTIAKPVVAVVMGVSGSGKTTVAVLLAAALGCQFQEGDELHPDSNVEKMRHGKPLTDADRLPWLRKIAAEIDGWRGRGESGVLTCSALKRSYRDIIIGERSDVNLVYLKGDYDLIHRRMAARQEHFMPVALLDSQFNALEEPGADERPIVVDIKGRPVEIVDEIVRRLELRQSGQSAKTSIGGNPFMNTAANDGRSRLEVLPDLETMSRRVADWMLELAVAKDTPFAVALSGGSTPKPLYKCLAEPPYRDRFPWPRTHWFWGDERFVPHDSVRSNFRMANEALLSHVPIPPSNIHPIPTQGPDPAAAASEYERTLKTFYGTDRLDPARPLFDINLLGLGDDGHTASLFPGSPVLTERERWAAAVIGAKPEERITLTYPALESSRYVAFLVAGEEKQAVFARLRRGDEALPATHVHPTGTLWMFADAAAAGMPASQA
jgi:6-phosphogluconolactonase